MTFLLVTIILFISFLLLLGLLEFFFHNKYLSQIPIRIHVNGSRGKSSVVRLIAAGLRGAGIPTIGKVTGSSPRIIDLNGNDVKIHRLRTASIGEQIKMIKEFSKYKPKAIVIECMAVMPQYQWISEKKMVKSTIGVITNVRPDHLDEMGYDQESIALSLSNSIPNNAKLILGESKFKDQFQSIADQNKTDIEIVNADSINNEYMENFPYLEHRSNIATALLVCTKLGIKKDLALKSIIKTNPDPGSLKYYRMNIGESDNIFINGFAANDPESSLSVWDLISHKFENYKSAIFLNTRLDREYRTKQLIHLAVNIIKPELFIIKGDNVNSILKEYSESLKYIKIVKFPDNSSHDIIINEIKTHTNYFILGMGNIVGWGEKFINKIEAISKEV